MSYGIYILDKRPKSKKAVKESINSVYLENTSMFGGYSGSIEEAPDGTYNFVGPDPYTSRKFYGTITKVNGKITCR